MKIRSYCDVYKNFKLGDTVWACAFNYTESKEAKYLYQKPVFGKFMAGNTEDKHNARIEKYPNETKPVYFVPFKKNGVDLAWSKAVQMSSRKYASTEEECIELYNELIDSAIRWHESEIEKLKVERV